MLLAPPPRIVDLEAPRRSRSSGNSRVEERAVVRELRGLVAVAESVRGVRHVERQRDDVAGLERLLERVDRVEIPRRAAHEVERPVEADVRDRLLLVGEVHLRDRLRRLVLQREAAGAVERAALGIDVDVGIDRGDLGLRQELVLLEVALVARLDVRGRSLAVEISLSTCAL